MKEPPETAVDLTEGEVLLLVGSLRWFRELASGMMERRPDEKRMDYPKIILDCEGLIKKIEAAFQKSIVKH